MKVKKSEKASLKLNIQNTKIMASDPITSWQIEGETMETVTDFIFLASKITADRNCSHEINRHLLLGRKAVTNLDSILKSRDITFPTKVYTVKTMVFPIVMYRYESWTIKKVGCWGIDTFKQWYWRRLWKTPLDCKEIKPVSQPWLFTARTDAEALILWPPSAKSQLIGEDPVSRKDCRQDEKGAAQDKMVGLHQGHNRHELGQTPGDGEEQEYLTCCSPWHHRVGHERVIEQEQVMQTGLPQVFRVVSGIALFWTGLLKGCILQLYLLKF